MNRCLVRRLVHGVRGPRHGPSDSGFGTRPTAAQNHSTRKASGSSLQRSISPQISSRRDDVAQPSWSTVL